MRINSKILGSFVIGFGLVAGAYLATHFGKTNTAPGLAAIYNNKNTATVHDYIPVTDKDSNGIEDWKEEFVNKTPIDINRANSGPINYKTPDTLTDQVGIQLFKAVMESKARGSVGPNKAKIIADTANTLRNTAQQDYIYKVNNIRVIGSSNEAIVTYANTVAQIIINNNIPGSEKELTIIERALQTENPAELSKLDPIIEMYKKLRDQTLLTPVPTGFEKQHLDLINVYNAIYSSLTGVKLAFSDPVVALLRIKRYQDDATGLGNALQNMYNALYPYAKLFTQQDPAVLFIAFGPKS